MPERPLFRFSGQLLQGGPCCSDRVPGQRLGTRILPRNPEVHDGRRLDSDDDKPVDETAFYQSPRRSSACPVTPTRRPHEQPPNHRPERSHTPCGPASSTQERPHARLDVDDDRTRTTAAHDTAATTISTAAAAAAAHLPSAVLWSLLRRLCWSTLRRMLPVTGPTALHRTLESIMVSASEPTTFS